MMAPLWLLLASLCAFCASSWAAVTLGPEFAPYQDMKQCLSKGARWYVVHRNVKEGAFGEDDYCLSDTQESDVVDGEARFRFSYGDGHERNATFVFKSTDGIHYNTFEAHVDGAPKAVKYNMLFVDCDTCKIMKCPTSEKCLMSVRESALRHGVPDHCYYLYGVLCGTENKHEVSDSSCLDD
ncbi:hypothetical protein HPB50_002325 [Hyalomma asiaticum]|uniref:Uncharacterized protein n=1 Tax=Hyalomma asiaticum TaxID=266040 RepID=A0ACB7S0X8_HYAAI|nr:hypothetical protein HPB50_002325 [Hyalomma asiaticum]